MKTIFGVAAVVALVLSSAINPRGAQQTPTFSSKSELVVLHVLVRDRHGAYVGGLQERAFRVYDDNQPQIIKFFELEDAPVTIGLIIDNSSSMAPMREQVIAASTAFVKSSNPKDEVFALVFDDDVRPVLDRAKPFTSDAGVLRQALTNVFAPAGRTSLYDAIESGLRYVVKGSHDRQALVVLSDGGDNASLHTRREMLGMVERSVATIYTIGLFDPEDADRDPGILERLAKISGGEAFLPASSAEMVPVCRRIAEDIRTRYTLGYLPRAGKGLDPVRHIRVRVTAPDLANPQYSHLVARTRSSYRYDEGQSEKPK